MRRRTSLVAAEGVIECLVGRQASGRPRQDAILKSAEPLTERNRLVEPAQLVLESDTHSFRLAGTPASSHLFGKAVHLLAADIERHLVLPCRQREDIVYTVPPQV